MLRNMTAALLPLALALSLAPTPSAAPVTVRLQAQQEDAFTLTIDPDAADASYSVGVPVLYTFGPEEAGSTPQTGGRQARITLSPRSGGKDGYKITHITARPLTENVLASVERCDGTSYGGRQAPVLTLAANCAPSDCALEDYAVALDITVGDFSGFSVSNRRDITVTIRGRESAAYARSRALENGGRYTVDETEGSVFSADGRFLSPARVDCSEQVSVWFEGPYEDDLANLRTVSDPIAEVEAAFPEAGVQFCTFVGAPSFSAPVRLTFDGPQELRLYAYDREAGSWSALETTYENDAHVLTARTLGCYFLAP